MRAEPGSILVEHGAPAEEPAIEIAIDPSANLLTTVEVAAIVAEARGRGRLRLRDGDVISGRIVVEGIDVEPGATIYVDGEVTLASSAASDLAGRFVPLPGDMLDMLDMLNMTVVEDVSIEEALLDEALMMGETPGIATDDGGVVMLAAVNPAAIAPSCPGVTKPPTVSGKQPNKLKLEFVASGNLGAMGGPACAAPAGMQVPPDAAPPVGSKSIRVTGGRGGAGMNVSVRTAPNVILTINGALCNGRGANGANATGTGGPGDPCKCGGDVLARGGRGGDAGDLTVDAWQLNWVVGGSLTVNPGGNGGNASATGGVGGNCNTCPGAGGRGGHALAYGGDPGSRGEVSIKASSAMNPDPDDVLDDFATVLPAASGGSATATAGMGGRGGEPCVCAQQGGEGGVGGFAYAHGGKGGLGEPLVAAVNGIAIASLPGDGGNGGNATATAGVGGDGGEGGDCLCSQPLMAGTGGLGGKGGSASARGGPGGDAKGGGSPVALLIPDGGNGGNATAACGNGGNGGKGGDCKLDQPEVCMKGMAGTGGMGGKRDAIGGKQGIAQSVPDTDHDGTPGTADPVTEMMCMPGGTLGMGVLRCQLTATCCVPHDAPGCEDPLCQQIVCTVDPFCCQVQWDQICADEAIQFCPICGGGGSSDCCIPHPGAGCDNLPCNKQVCSNDPFCCDVQWDTACANQALQSCAVCETGGGADCCVAHPSPGCKDGACKELVCSFLPQCCELQWDIQCAELAQEVCAVCGVK